MTDSTKALSCRAIVADGHGRYSLESTALLPPAGDEVLVEIKAAGICHTDWDSILTWEIPFVVGHEGAGVVSAVGSDVKNFNPGDAVVLNWAISCGNCAPCRQGLFPLCEAGSAINGDGVRGHARPEATKLVGMPLRRSFNLGTMSDYTIVKEAACQPMQDGVPFEVAAIMGCGVMTGFGSVVNVAKVGPGASVAVLGCGGIGLSVIQACVISGASRIIAIDVDQGRLDRARSFGATHTVLSEPSDPAITTAVEAVKTITTRGADYAFECTGVPALGAAPLALVRHGGMAIQVSGIEQSIDFDCTLFEWDKTYINPLYGRCDPQRDFDKLQTLYRARALNLDDMISRRYRLDDLQQAFDDMLAGRLAKGVIIPGTDR